MYLLIGLLGLVTLVVAVLGSSYFSAKWLAGRLGISPFRLFDPYPLGSWTRRLLVRAMSVATPLALVWVLGFSGAILHGQEVGSNRIETMEGPARDAGLEDGDRIVAVDGMATADFEAIRRGLKSPRPTHEVAFERGGKRRTVTVTPDETGAVRIRAMMDRRPMSVLAASRMAVQLPWEVWKPALSFPDQKSELSGPVGIVASVPGHSTSTLQAILVLMAGQGAILSGILLAAHLFDGLTALLLPRPASKDPDDATRSRALLARRRQAMGIAAVLVLVMFALISVGEVTGTFFAPLSSTISLALGAPIFPLVWLLANQLHSRKRAVLMTALLLIPLVGLGVVVWLWIAAGRSLRESRGQPQAAP